jgi:glutathione S-transferase
VVAEQFSLADMCYVPLLEFLPLMEIVPPNAVEPWSQRLLARPSSDDLERLHFGTKLTPRDVPYWSLNSADFGYDR